MSKDIRLRNLFLHDYSPSRPYVEFQKAKDRRSEIAHWGHAKLFMEEVLFITLYVSRIKEIDTILYIGSAPFNHGHILSQMFPQYKFVLYDPRNFIIPPAFKYRFEIHQQLFTDDDAQEWIERGPRTAIISDIRSIPDRASEDGVSDEEKSRLIDEAVRRDMALQMGWVKTINPATASLKFRLPFPAMNPETGFNDVDEIYPYLDGYIMLQPFRGSSSSECRLIPVKMRGQYVEKRYSSVLYQDQNHYHNLMVRPSLYHNPFTGDFTNVFGNELLCDYDSIASTLILMSYLEMCTGKRPSQDDTVALYQVFLAGTNAMVKDPLSMARVRASEFRSTIMKGAMKGKKLRDVIPAAKHIFKPYTRIQITDPQLVAPTPIAILV